MVLNWKVDKWRFEFIIKKDKLNAVKLINARMVGKIICLSMALKNNNVSEKNGSLVRRENQWKNRVASSILLIIHVGADYTGGSICLIL